MDTLYVILALLLEIAKLNEESAKQRRKISQMEGVIERQGAALREFQNKFNNLQVSLW